jgi:hypothetical protein
MSVHAQPYLIKLTNFGGLKDIFNRMNDFAKQLGDDIRYLGPIAKSKKK